MFWVDERIRFKPPAFIKFIILWKLSQEYVYQIIEIQLIKRNRIEFPKLS
jgi:hypothetical protein